jgi:hypothetical protein
MSKYIRGRWVDIGDGFRMDTGDDVWDNFRIDVGVDFRIHKAVWF